MNQLEGALSNLSGPLGAYPKYRFPKRGAQLLAAATDAIYSHGESLRDLLVRMGTAPEARRYLAAAVAGVGPKQASLFLVSIGFTQDVAALDRHLLSYLKLTRNYSDKPDVSSLATYTRLEDELRKDAHQAGVTLAVFDLSTWVLMRTWRQTLGREE